MATHCKVAGLDYSLFTYTGLYGSFSQLTFARHLRIAALYCLLLDYKFNHVPPVIAYFISLLIKIPT